MRDAIAIAAGPLRAEIVPSLGGGLARFDRVDGGTPTPIFRPWPAEGTDDPNQLACYVLVPWSNRISGGGFPSGGRFHPLEPNCGMEPFPLHGNGWTSAWHVTAADAASASLHLSADGPGPFRYDASLGYALDAKALTMALAVTNRAPTALPYGLGFHPWLPRTAATRLQAPASAVWMEDSRHLPAGPASVALPEAWNFSMPRALPARWINNGFAGWDRRARIAWPDRRLVLDVTASAALSTFILFSPGSDADFFCFEPVSHPVDAHNLPGGPGDNGLAILRPDESLSVECRFSVEAS